MVFVLESKLANLKNIQGSTENETNEQTQKTPETLENTDKNRFVIEGKELLPDPIQVAAQMKQEEQEKPEGFVDSSYRTMNQVVKSIPYADPRVGLPGLAKYAVNAREVDPEEYELTLEDSPIMDWILGWILDRKKPFKSTLEELQKNDPTLTKEKMYEEISKGYHEAASNIPIPTLEDLYEKAEEYTGLPLEAKTPIQKKLSVASDVAMAFKNPEAAVKMGFGAVQIYSFLTQEMGMSEDKAGMIARSLAWLGGDKETPKQEVKEPKLSTTEKVNQTVTGTPPPPPPPPGTPPGPGTPPSAPPASFNKSAAQTADKAKQLKPHPFKEELQPIKIESAKPIHELEQKASTFKDAKQVEGVPVETVKSGGIVADKLSKPLHKFDVKNRNPLDRVGEKIAPYKIENESKGGARIQQIMNSKKEEIQSLAGKAPYAESRALNTEAIAERKQMHQELLNFQAKLGSSESANPRLRKIQHETQKIIDEFAPIEFEDGVETFPNISNQQIIDKIQGLNSLSKKNKSIHLLTKILKKEIKRSAEQFPKAVEEYENANRGYAVDYAFTFKNPAVQKFLNPENIEYAKVYKEANDPDIFNFIRETLESTPEGKLHSRIIQRNIVEKALKPILTTKDGKFNQNVTIDQVNNVLDSLPIQLSEGMKTRVAKSVDMMKIEHKYAPKPEVKQPKAKESKQIDLSFGLEKKMNSVSEIRKIENQISTNSENIEKFKELKEDFGTRLIEKNIPKNKETIDGVEAVLGDVDKKAVLTELWGKERVSKIETQVAQQRAAEQRIAEHQSKLDAINKKIKTTTNKQAQAKLEKAKAKEEETIAVTTAKYLAKQGSHYLLKTLPLPKEADVLSEKLIDAGFDLATGKKK